MVIQLLLFTVSDPNITLSPCFLVTISTPVNIEVAVCDFVEWPAELSCHVVFSHCEVCEQFVTLLSGLLSCPAMLCFHIVKYVSSLYKNPNLDLC